MTNTSDGICRVCESADDLEMIFEEVNAEILEMLQAASDSQIRADDGFPKHVCIACIFSLEDFYQFKSLYESTYRKWKRLTNGSGQIKKSAGKTIDPEVGTNAKINFHTPEETNEIFFNSQVVDDQSGSSDSVRDDFEKQAAIYVMNGKESVATSYRNAVQDQQQNSGNPPDVNIIAREQQPSTDKDNAKEKHTCHECSKSFKRISALNRHKQLHSRSGRYACNECEKTFADPSILKKHQALHSNPNLHNCTQCGKSFAYLYLLKRHQKQHSNSTTFSCGVCGKVFCHLISYEKHTVKHPTPDIYKCEECGKTFSYAQGLKYHQKLHSNPRPFKCQECGKSFAYSNSLKVHEAFHFNPNIFNCEDCGKRFKCSRDLNEHMILHVNSSNFGCKECGKMFQRSHAFKVHQALHANPQLYKCEECGKVFQHSHSLKVHRDQNHVNPKSKSKSKSALLKTIVINFQRT